MQLPLGAKAAPTGRQGPRRVSYLRSDARPSTTREQAALRGWLGDGRVELHIPERTQTDAAPLRASHSAGSWPTDSVRPDPWADRPREEDTDRFVLSGLVRRSGSGSGLRPPLPESLSQPDRSDGSARLLGASAEADEVPSRPRRRRPPSAARSPHPSSASPIRRASYGLFHVKRQLGAQRSRGGCFRPSGSARRTAGRDLYEPDLTARARHRPADTQIFGRNRV